MVVVWPLVRRIAAGGPRRAVAQKSLNAVAILLGQGLSTLYDDTDERLGIRIAGVVIGLVYAALVLMLVRRRTAVPEPAKIPIHGDTDASFSNRGQGATTGPGATRRGWR